MLAPIEAGKSYHCLVTYSASAGELACFLNGREVYRNASRVTGDFSNWTTQQFVIGDEAGDDPRPWLGRVEGFALFNRAMDADTAAKRFRQLVP